MPSERKTEAIVRQHFEGFSEDVRIEEQHSDNPTIKNLLRSASKAGSGRPGRPEFIIRFQHAPNLLAVVECKASLQKHQSKDLQKPQEFAVDGALFYAERLSKGYDVLAIAVSGTAPERLKVSHHLWLKGSSAPIPSHGRTLLAPADYIKGYIENPEKFRQDYRSLQGFIECLNKRLHTCKVGERNRAILISCLLIALDRRSFKNAYMHEEDPSRLSAFVVESAIAQLRDADVTGDRLEVLKQQFSFLASTQVLSKKKHVLRDIIEEVDREINSFIKTHQYRDVLGSLYVEFLRHANSDKGLGIVLTPPHITELFSDLAQVNARSVVYDNCTGTGGFLISAMRKMIADADGDRSAEDAIKRHGIIGVEIQENIYPLAVSNMYIHQDGKSNIYLGSCHDKGIAEIVRGKMPNIGFLNPPYRADKTQDEEELLFVLNNLECLQPGGTCIAIVPMQSALSTKGKTAELKSLLMSKHTLEAVCSMPDELFFNSNVNVVSCIMVFTAHKPHTAKKDVFLGYFKNDGFVKRRIGGRCDAGNLWEKTKEEWLSLFFNRKSKPGISVCAALTKDDEWAPEAYMETDYSVLTDAHFEHTLHQYASHLFSDRICSAVSEQRAAAKGRLSADISAWGHFPLAQLFAITGSQTTHPRKLRPHSSGEKFPYVTTKSENNGIRGYYANKTEEGKVLTVDSAVAGYCAYQHWGFSASDHVEKLTPRQFALDPFLGMFFATVINLEQYRYNYGRKCSQARLASAKILLPKNSSDGGVDFAFMRKYMQQRLYSSSIRALPNSL